MRDITCGHACRFYDSFKSCLTLYCFLMQIRYGGRHMIFWYLSQSTGSEGSDETAHLHSLVRTFAARIHKI